MCGIIGITSSKPVSLAIINSLRKLEYRGYDSAGIATLSNGAINEDSIVGAGSVITKNVRKKSLALTRANQLELLNYKRKNK